MIEVKNVTKYYSNVKAVNDLSFNIQKGEIVGFLGPNGAGKSTTLKIMSGLIRPSSGSVSIFGFDVFLHPIEAKAKIGYLSEKNPLYEEYSVEEYLKFIARIKGLTNINKEIQSVADKVFISKVMGKTIKTLSKGYKQRVGLAAALLGGPELLLLDEPTVGLDPNQIVDIRNVIKSLGATSTILLSTHILQEVSAICDKVIIINEGNLIAIDEPENLSRRLSGENRLILTVKNYNPDVANSLKNIDAISNVEVENDQDLTKLLIFSQSETEIQNDVLSILLNKDVQIIEMKLDALSLETIFQKLTKGQDNA